MGKLKYVYDEYQRLKSLFDSVDPSKAELVDELLKKAAFLKVQLDELEFQTNKNGTIQYSNQGNVRQSVAYKTYLNSLNIYQGIIKTLNQIMGKNLLENDDEFDDFIKLVNNELS